MTKYLLNSRDSALRKINYVVLGAADLRIIELKKTRLRYSFVPILEKLKQLVPCRDETCLFDGALPVDLVNPPHKLQVYKAMSLTTAK